MKRFISLALAAVMMLSVCAVGVFAEESSLLILGDTTIDGKVNVKDATLIQKHLAKLAEFDEVTLMCADCDCSGEVNIKDATWIQKFSANFECPYPIGEEIKPDQSEPETTVVPTTAEITLAETTINTDAVETTAEVTSASTVPTSSATSTDPQETTVVITTVVAPTTTDALEVTTVAETTSTVQVTTTAVETTVTETPAQTVTSEVTTMVTEPVNPPVKPDTNITIYFSNNVKWSTVNVYLYNENTGAQLAEWPGTAMKLKETNSYGETIYEFDVDVSVYNRVIFNNGKSQTMNAAVTVASSGYFITTQTPKSAMQLGVYAYGTEDYGTKTTTTLKYPTGYNKKIEIWTPAGYNPADTSKKYSVIYLLDGQHQFDDTDAYNGGWGSDEVITALMKNGGDGIILVGIDNSSYRDSELTPDIGDVIPAYASQGFENGTGIRFANFVADTVVPYIESNYNVYTDAAHSAIVGSSSGGIEAFYIGIEHMDEFGMIGALSPAFMLFDKATWMDYFSKYDFANTAKLPRIYFYNGGGDALENELLPYARDMKGWLKGLGYPEGNMTFVFDDKNAHNEAAWRNVMPEVVSWLFELQ